jgi:SAM-dependent methyltransferase
MILIHEKFIMKEKNEEDGVMFQDYALDRVKKPHLIFRYKLRAHNANWALKKFGCTNRPRILDLGSADGLTMDLLHNLCNAEESVGIEYTQELIDSCDKLSSGCRLEQGDVTNLKGEFLKGEFDLVTALALLEHISDPSLVFQQAYKALAPSGLFVASCPNPFWDKLSGLVGLHKEEFHNTDFRWTLFRVLCKENGFEPIKYKPFMFVPYAFLPYLKMPVSIQLADILDSIIWSLRFLNFTFVNQLFIARKLS